MIVVRQVIIPASMPRVEPATVEDWRRVRETLLREEHRLELLIAQGDHPVVGCSVDKQRAQLFALRELCEAVLDRLLMERHQFDRPPELH